MDEYIPNIRDIEQVIFAGSHSFKAMEFRGIRKSSDSSGDYWVVEAGEKTWWFFKKHRTFRSIHKSRIFFDNGTPHLGITNGRLTITINAEVNAIDNNQSYVDNYTKMLQATNMKADLELKFANEKIDILKGMLIELDSEESWKERRKNMVKQLSVEQKLLKQGEGTSSQVSVSVGDEEKKKK